MTAEIKASLNVIAHQMVEVGIPYDSAVRAFQREYLLSVLARSRYNQCKAAAELGMHRNTLHRTLTECGITGEELLDLKSRRAK